MIPRLVTPALPALVVAVFFVASGCKGDDNSGGSLDLSTPEITSAPAVPSPTSVLPQPDPVQPLDATANTPRDGTVEIAIEAASFKGNRIELPIGEPVIIRVLNRDNQSHNLRIAGFDGQYQTEDDAVTEPETINGGQSGEVTFAPTVPGDYTFHCDFHPGTMGGRITVQ